MLVFLLIAVVGAQKLPDPPALRLDQPTFQRYGISSQDLMEIRSPGYFDKLLDKKIDSNITDISQFLQSGYDSSVLGQGFINMTNYTLDFFKNRPENKIVTFLTARLIDVMYRVFYTLYDFDEQGIKDVNELADIDSAKALVSFCEKSTFAQTVAEKTSGALPGKSNTELCNSLPGNILNQPETLQSYITDLVTNKLQIIRIVRNIEAGGVTILPIITPSPVPTTGLFYQPQVKELKNNLKPYQDYIKSIQGNSKLENYKLFGKELSEWANEVEDRVNTFLSYYP